MNRVLVLLALAGCDSVFGLDRAPVDAAPDVIITGRITERYLHGAAGFTLVAETMPLQQDDAPTVRFEGNDVPVGWSASEGLFTFTVPGGAPYQLFYRGEEFQSNAPTLLLDVLTPGRPSAIPPAAGTILRITPTSPLPQNANVYVETTGIFSVTKANTVTTSDFQVQWPNAGFQGTPGLLDAAHDDLAYLVTYINDAAGYEVLDSFTPASTTMVQGTTTTAPGPVTQLVRDQCVTVEPPLIAAEQARLTALLPAYAPSDVSFTLFQAARPDLGISVAYTLASDHTTAGVISEDIRYGIAFPSFGPVMTYTAKAQRTVGGLELDALLIYFDALPPSTACAPHPIPTGVAIPLDPELAGVGITDNVTIGLPAGADPVVTWRDSPGTISPTSYKVTLYVGDKPLHAISTAKPRAILDRAMFAAGTLYTLEIVSSNGLPGFPDGDLLRQQFPYGAAIVRTSPFKVSP